MWLKFAETKHAGLIALNSGILFGALSVYKDYKESIPPPAVLVAFTFIVASLVTSFISLFPRSIQRIEQKKRPKNANLFFGAALAMYDKETLKKELLQRINRKHEFDLFEEDLIQQMIANSIIGIKKYYLLKLHCCFW